MAKGLNKKAWRGSGDEIVRRSVRSLLGAVLFSVIFISGVAVYEWFASLQSQVEELKGQVEQLTAENQELKVENDELDSAVQLLSSTVSLHTHNEEERQRLEAILSLPTEFPVTGAVSMREVTIAEIRAKQEEAASSPEGTEVEQLESDTPIMIFIAQEGNSVIASGSGKVTAVEEDKIYGKVITIDHGNGYVTKYRNAGAAKVTAGDTVTRGTVLYVVGSSNTVIGFQIEYEGEYIDPMDVVEIAG